MPAVMRTLSVTTSPYIQAILVLVFCAAQEELSPPTFVQSGFLMLAFIPTATDSDSEYTRMLSTLPLAVTLSTILAETFSGHWCWISHWQVLLTVLSSLPPSFCKVRCLVSVWQRRLGCFNCCRCCPGLPGAGSHGLLY